MIGLDTNVIVRYITQDDETQSVQATTLIESLSAAQPGFIAIVSIVELVWVLQDSYGADKNAIILTLDALLKTKEILIEQADIIYQALRVFTQSNADFADCVIERLAHAAQCEYTVTFDKNAAQQAGMRLINSH